MPAADSTGDLFADLGSLRLHEEERLKVAIARAITRAIQQKELSQAEAAKLIGVDHAKVSKIMGGRLENFSVARLMNMLLALGCDFGVTISESSGRRRGSLSIRSA